MYSSGSWMEVFFWFSGGFCRSNAEGRAPPVCLAASSQPRWIFCDFYGTAGWGYLYDRTSWLGILPTIEMCSANVLILHYLWTRCLQLFMDLILADVIKRICLILLQWLYSGSKVRSLLFIQLHCSYYQLHTSIRI